MSLVRPSSGTSTLSTSRATVIQLVCAGCIGLHMWALASVCAPVLTALICVISLSIQRHNQNTIHATSIGRAPKRSTPNSNAACSQCLCQSPSAVASFHAVSSQTPLADGKHVACTTIQYQHHRQCRIRRSIVSSVRAKATVTAAASTTMINKAMPMLCF
jgi:hypothetical protein